MKISRHTDGSFSITGMSRDDVENLTMAASSACAFYVTNPAGGDAAWNGQRLERFDRLYKALNVARQARERGSVTLSSAYHVLRQTGLRSWWS